MNQLLLLPPLISYSIMPSPAITLHSASNEFIIHLHNLGTFYLQSKLKHSNVISGVLHAYHLVPRVGDPYAHVYVHCTVFVHSKMTSRSINSFALASAKGW